jgi:predicted oxidoreductase (fatty acid repression mutant protein)
MENGPTTIDSIIAWLQDVVESKKSIAPQAWIEISQRANILLGDESDKLYELQQKIAQEKVSCMESGKGVSECRMRAEATDDYKESQKIKAKIERTIEMIRLSKLQARLRDEEFRGGNI